MEQKYRNAGLSQKDAEEAADKRIRAEKFVAAVAGISVAAYVGYKAVDSGNMRRLLTKTAMARGESSVFRKNADLAKSDMGADEITHSVVSRINPGYGKFGTKTNCRRCTFAYEMSRRGYDVAATKTHGGTGQHVYGFYKAVGQTELGGRVKAIKQGGPLWNNVTTN